MVIDFIIEEFALQACLILSVVVIAIGLAFRRSTPSKSVAGRWTPATRNDPIGRAY